MTPDRLPDSQRWSCDCHVQLSFGCGTRRTLQSKPEDVNDVNANAANVGAGKDARLTDEASILIFDDSMTRRVLETVVHLSNRSLLSICGTLKCLHISPQSPSLSDRPGSSTPWSCWWSWSLKADMWGRRCACSSQRLRMHVNRAMQMHA